ncbi:MAG: alpha/beta hydrolase [Alphaproteobacteria bacterium]|nr:alpha/beta hydrolase [Alphaproteobacteria bacterium]
MELTVNGHKVHAATGGKDFDASLPAVIFVHGAGLDRTVWALQTRYFAHHGHTVLAVDLPGHGKSEGPPLDTVPALGDWLAALIDAAGLEKATLVGHSMGSLVALECAARHRGKVRALALVGAATAMPVHPDLLAAAAANDRSAYEAITYWGFSRPAQLGRGQAPGMWMVGAGVELLAHGPAGVLHTDLAACAAYESGLDSAAKVTCPVRLILADGDFMTPLKGGKALADAFHAADIIILNRCGHMIMAEQPDATLDALIGFV